MHDLRLFIRQSRSSVDCVQCYVIRFSVLCRYLAICHGLRCHVTGKMARVIIVLIWSFATSIMSPWAVFYQQLEHEDPQLPTGNASDVTAQPTTTATTSGSGAQYVCVQSWPSPSMERNYFLVAIFVTCYTIPLVVISVCYALIGRRVCNRGALGLHDGGAQTVVQRSKVCRPHAPIHAITSSITRRYMSQL